MTFLPFSPKDIIILRVAQFFAGVLKSTGTGYIVLSVFSLFEATSGAFIAASIISKIGTLGFFSKSVYILTVIIEFVYLAGDIFFAWGAVNIIRDKNWKDKLNTTLTAILTTFLCMTPIVMMILLGFQRLKWSVSSVVVANLVDSEIKSQSLWICLFGLVLTFLTPFILSLVVVLGINHVIISNRFRRMLFLACLICCMLGLGLISGAGLKATEELSAGYMLLTLIILPSTTSFLLTGFMAYFINMLNNDSSQDTEPVLSKSQLIEIWLISTP